MRLVKKMGRLLGRLLLTALLLAFAVSAIGYLFTPVYNFGATAPLSGDSIYNPYSGIDLSTLKRAIFHFHSTRSDGADEPEEIVNAYIDMGYDIVSLADHHRVVEAGLAPPRELRTYEHGLNAYRFHSVVFGAEKTSKYLLPLWMTLSQRYHMLRHLEENFDIVVLNHPKTTRCLIPEQMEQLSHYQYIEADWDLDNGSPPLWDVALSAGHYSFVMANDDLHDLSKPYAIGRAMTFVATPTTDAASVTDALRKGHGYALRVWYPSQNRDSVYLPQLTQVDLSGDTIKVAFNQTANILFIGQGGVVQKEVQASDAHYVFKQEDSYIRVEARFDIAGRTSIYLNPLARFSPPSLRPENASYAERSGWQTIISISFHALLMLFALLWIVMIWRKKRRRCSYYTYR